MSATQSSTPAPSLANAAILDATNITNEDAYRPRQYNGSAGQLITAMPYARYNVTAKYSFK